MPTCIGRQYESSTGGKSINSLPIKRASTRMIAASGSDRAATIRKCLRRITKSVVILAPKANARLRSYKLANGIYRKTQGMSAGFAPWLLKMANSRSYAATQRNSQLERLKKTPSVVAHRPSLSAKRNGAYKFVK